MKTALQLASFFRRHPMVNIIILDAGPPGLVTHPKGGEDARISKAWLEGQLREGTRVRIPAIADYEVRRELIRAGKHQALERLDALVQKLGYIPLVEQAMRVAAELWADARRSGRPTAPNYSLDADRLLAAQARTFLDLNRIHRWEKFTRKEKRAGISVQIATTNIGHLSRYAHVIEIPSP